MCSLCVAGRTSTVDAPICRSAQAVDHRCNRGSAPQFALASARNSGHSALLELVSLHADGNVEMPCDKFTNCGDLAAPRRVGAIDVHGREWLCGQGIEVVQPPVPEALRVAQIMDVVAEADAE